jgi:Tol biopolymer transport system component
MSMSPGTRLGPYEIVEPIGAGGMGEVYRARDARLNRDVALKILPEAFATDTDRLARFRREAQVLASLNHPNIGHIYGFEDSGTTHALVLELIEGPTLADRIAAGAVPLAEALPIARQIADALEAAHEQGIVHRDLKPANVKVRDDGTVKVLDFGLAKAFDPAASSAAEAMHSPTLTARATQMGVIIGTAAYMSPEQARGRAVDRRADIWAFGVVLFEMLTGRRAFDGDDISITLAAVLKDDLTWSALPGDLPSPVRRLLRRCLEKDPKRRLSSIGDARLELEEAGAAREDHVATPAAAVLPPPSRRILPWAAAAAGFLAALACLLLWQPWRPLPSAAPLRLNAEIGADASLETTVAPATVLAADGRTLAFAAADGSGVSHLYLRRLEQLTSTLLSGTDSAQGPFFSPDGQWIGFFADGKLRKISVTGGAPITLCEAASLRGAWWGDDGAIIFATNSAGSTRLQRVSAAGGAPAIVGELASGETAQRWPQVLPRGRGVLYSGNATAAGWENGSIMVMPLPSGAPKVVLRGGFHGRYLRSGHLAYLHDGTLFAVPFDLEKLQTVGEPVPVIEGVLSSATTGSAQFSVSNAGILLYTPGKGTDFAAPIFWMDQKGTTSTLRGVPAVWALPRFSPDGQKLALMISDNGALDVWIYEHARDTMTRFTFDPANDRSGVWTPDGRRLAFSSERGTRGIYNIYWQRADGTGEIQRLTDSPSSQAPFSFHPSGKFLAYAEARPRTGQDLMILPLDGDETRGWKTGPPTVFLSTPAAEFYPIFSPDGRWIAYQSNESGRTEVFVRPFPGPGGKWQISTLGGTTPMWSQTRPELLYEQAGKVMAASYTVTADAFHADKPHEWAPTPVQPFITGSYPTVDLHPDGKRLAMLKRPELAEAKRDKVVFVFNFFDELRRVAPAGK